MKKENIENVIEDDINKKGIEKLSVSFGTEDMNLIVEKINEIIGYVS